jgi:hypothetical protein
MTKATPQGTRSSPTPLFGVLALLAGLVGLPLALAARADAEPAVGTAIGRANLDGTGVDHVFIDSGLGYEGDVASTPNTSTGLAARTWRAPRL